MSARRCPTESARRARPHDAPEIAALRSEARAILATARGGEALVGRDHPSEQLDAIIDAGIDGDPTCLVLVGTLDEMIVGYCFAHMIERRASAPVTEIVAIWVTPEARGIGVGEALVDRALEWATACGSVAIDADALPGDRATKNFFEAHGLVARGIRVSRSLASGTDRSITAEARRFPDV